MIVCLLVKNRLTGRKIKSLENRPDCTGNCRFGIIDRHYNADKR